MKTLSTLRRRQLERTVVEARDIAEAGARGALESLAVHYHKPYRHMNAEQRKLRRRLRAHARHVGDRVDARSASHTIDHIVHECAYEHWHGMLFARFLAESHLLIEPETGVTVTLDECEELARDEGLDKWALASRYAHRMLPQVFRPDHPVFDVKFAREYQLKLEDLAEDLPTEVFTATDSLGWVYQFWQTKKKNEVNSLEIKVGANELPAVTQLFTEPYMVQFLLHNSLGAWWVSRVSDTCPVDLVFLRRTDGGAAAAGTFEGWPETLAEFRLLDPCCGSGHFLVAAFLLLTPMRMALENLSAAAAVDAVLRENIHGLELDQRCVSIAAFALALEAWRYPNAGGYRTLPRINLAWCGQSVVGKGERWHILAEGDSRLEAGMAALYETFREAPTLGSLIDPARSVSEDILTAGFDALQPLFKKALQEHASEEEWEEAAIAALGIAEAASLLSKKYHLIITNVPYLTRGKQSDRLQKFIETHYPLAKSDLANVFLERCLELGLPKGIGVVQVVVPQYWLFLSAYKKQRENLLIHTQWKLLARLGSGAFKTISGEVVNVVLLTISPDKPVPLAPIYGIDVNKYQPATKKAEKLITETLQKSTQVTQLNHPNHVIEFKGLQTKDLLSKYAKAWQGIVTADDNRFVVCFWEVNPMESDWEWLILPPQSTEHWSGRSKLIRWEKGEGTLHTDSTAHNFPPLNVLGQPGVAIQRMSRLNATLYQGEIFGDAVAPIVFHKDVDLRLRPAVWALCSNPIFREEVRKLTQKVNVTPGTLNKIHFDASNWEAVALDQYPHGLPKPYSNDLTQWIFHGHPCSSVVWSEENKQIAYGPPRIDATVLQATVARLLGFRWPAENDHSIPLADKQRALVKKTKLLYPFEDQDGIVCIPSVRGERPAHERLWELLQAAYGGAWHDRILSKLLEEARISSLDEWLRNKFFAEHCKLFFQRPFIWHIWDGRRSDGFHALVSYHSLAESKAKGRSLLESLTYSYLGDWIARQRDGIRRSEDGAEGRLVAALELQKQLAAILKGEPPFDIFVRWKSMKYQAIGWEPDINDGVRANIRPFMARDLNSGTKGAGVLRAKPNIHWGKDKGKERVRDQLQYPWFWDNGKFTTARINDVNLTNAVKSMARTAAGERN